MTAHDPRYYCRGILGIWTLSEPQRPWKGSCPCGWGSEHFEFEAEVAAACRSHLLEAGVGVPRWATISPDGQYRYDLGRRWGEGPLLAFVMLNPSTADAEVDDPTIRRCVGFAKREGCGGIIVRNLFAFRTPSPKALKAAAKGGVDIVGHGNWGWLQPLRQKSDGHDPIKMVVSAWGVPGSFADKQARVALDRVCTHRFDVPGRVSSHPLYLRGDTPIVPLAAPCG